MEKKTLKAIAIAFIGLLIWIGMIYIAFAFVNAELNPFVWSQGLRAAMVFTTVCYIAFAPLIVNELKH
jgi:hypothetical protein